MNNFYHFKHDDEDIYIDLDTVIAVRDSPLIKDRSIICLSGGSVVYVNGLAKEIVGMIIKFKRQSKLDRGKLLEGIKRGKLEIDDVRRMEKDFPNG